MTTYSCSLLSVADSSSVFNPCTGFSFSSNTGVLALSSSASDVKNEPSSYFSTYSIQITATASDLETATCSYSLTLSAPCTDPLFCVITVPDTYESFDYAIGSTNPLEIPHPPSGEFSASREDVCGRVQVFLQDNYDHDVVTPGNNKLVIESSDSTLLDDPTLILKYSTTLYEH